MPTAKTTELASVQYEVKEYSDFVTVTYEIPVEALRAKVDCETYEPVAAIHTGEITFRKKP